MLLSQNGILFAYGENQFGELGLGDHETRTSPEKITYFTDNNEKVVEVSCGFKHSICRTSLKKIFTWGINKHGQLGLGDKANRALPEQITIQNHRGQRLPPRSVQAGMHSCFILSSDRNLYYTGKIGSSQRPSLLATKFNYESKFYAHRVTDNFGPVKVCCKWSSMMTATYVVFADFRQNKTPVGNREKQIDQISAEWLVDND